VKTRNWKTYAIWIAICEAVGIVAGLLSMEGMAIYNATAVKPALTPPGWLFPVVWTVLYALMGIAAARVTLADQSPDKEWGLLAFTAQLVVNFFWPLFFFNLQAYGFAFVWLIILWLLVLLTILLFRKVDKTAAWLMVPYLVWLTFAAYLNAMVWSLNK